jgi:hypothetical protein
MCIYQVRLIYIYRERNHTIDGLSNVPCLANEVWSDVKHHVWARCAVGKGILYRAPVSYFFVLGPQMKRHWAQPGAVLLECWPPGPGPGYRFAVGNLRDWGLCMTRCYWSQTGRIQIALSSASHILTSLFPSSTCQSIYSVTKLHLNQMKCFFIRSSW